MTNGINTKGHYMDGFKADGSKGAWENFKDLIALQEGGLSKDPNDSASVSIPPQPHTDGYFYHTNRGWTWATWRATRKRFGLTATPQQFYKMNRAQSDVLKDRVFFADFQLTKNELINVFCMYISWGGGWYGGRFENAYKKLTGKSLKKSFSEDTDEDIYKNLVNARIKDLINISLPGTKNNRYQKTWVGAIAIFNREFAQFLKKK